MQAMSDKLSLHCFTLMMAKISQNYNETELRSLWPKETPQIRKLHLSYENILEDLRQDKFFLLTQLCVCISMPKHVCFGNGTKLESLSLLHIHC